jgi:hypothetical protein
VNCKACNTRLPDGGRICPHCGHAHPRSEFIGQSSRSSSGSVRDPGSSASRLSPSNATYEPEPEEEVELPLEDAMAIGKDRSTSARPRPAGGGDGASRRPPSSSGIDPAARRREKPSPPARKPAPRKSSGDGSASVPMPLDAEALRHLIGEQPGLLESGLRVLGEEGRKRVGIGYGTEVGEIDLLARSDSGDWVVVMVADADAGPSLVSDVLHRVGWVRKHLCEEGDAVRAIVLLERMDEALGYAATAVADTIDFRTWRVSIEFERVEV